MEEIPSKVELFSAATKITCFLRGRDVTWRPGNL